MTRANIVPVPPAAAMTVVMLSLGFLGACGSGSAGAGQDAATAGSGGRGLTSSGGTTGSGGAQPDAGAGTGGLSTGGTSSGGSGGGGDGVAGNSGSGGAGGGPGAGGGGGRASGGDTGAGGGGKGGGGAQLGGAGGGGFGGRGGAAGAAGGTGVYSPCPAPPAVCKILPFGDSITFGVGSNGSGSNGGYRVELFHRAHLDGKAITFVGTSQPNGPATVDGVAFPPQNEGHSGFTIDNEPATATMPARSGISPLVATVMSATKPDVVTLMIGTNDLQHGYDVANAPARLGKLIDSIIAANAHTVVVVAQIVPTTDATLNPTVQAYNAAIPALVSAYVAAGKHVLMADMYQAIASDPNFMTSGRTVVNNTVGPMFDWLHPNVEGYKLMGDAWYEILKPLLR